MLKMGWSRVVNKKSEKGRGVLRLVAAIFALLFVAGIAIAQSGGIATFNSHTNELYLPEIAYGSDPDNTESFSAVTVRLGHIDVLGAAADSAGLGASAAFDPSSSVLKLGAVIADGSPYFDADVKIGGIELLSTSDTLRPDKTLPWITAEVVSPRVSFRTFSSQIVGGEVSYHIYLPQTYTSAPDRLPVVYWLHGTEGGVAGIPPVATFFDDAIRAEKLPPMIVVFVNGLPRRLWADSKDGSSPVESVFVKELIPHVDNTFRTIASRKGRILEGFSMGGYGAARIGFKFSQLFAGISILAGGPMDLEFDGPRANRAPALRAQLISDVCSNDLNYFQAISPLITAHASATLLRTQKTTIRQLVGTLDDTRDLNFAFHIQMDLLGIPHQYLDIPNVGHSALGLLQGAGELNGDFYRQALGIK
jgi:enterochelin esterase-like enzyme